MRISYRTQRVLGRIAVTLLVIAVVLALIWLCWFFWLGRFVIYTDSGAKVDMDHPGTELTGVPAQPPQEESGISIYYNEGENAINTGKELVQMNGYYITAADLKEGIAPIRTQLSQLSAGTAVLVDVKNSFGEFFYSSSVGSARASSIDPVEMDGLIDHLTKSNLYAVARIPAFQDYTFGLNNVDDGLFSVHGAYLWRDDMGCYWLNPAREGTVSYLVQIVTELKQLGFDEVVFDQFYFPENENYRFNGDRYQTLLTTANTLVTTCSTDSFAVSFVGESTFPLPEGRSRLYVQNAEAAAAAGIAQSAPVADTAVYLVFLTEVHDTRFDVYSVLRPISTVR